MAALPIAALWVVPQYVDPMAGRSPEGPLVVLRRVDPTVVPPTVAHMAEQPFAARTEGQPSLLVALTAPIMVPVPLQRVSRLARRPVRRRLPPIATTHLIAIPRHIILHHPGSVRKGGICRASVLRSIIRFWFYALYLFVIFAMLALHGSIVAAAA